MRRLADRNFLVLAAVFVLGSAAYFTVRDVNGHVGGVAELDGYYYYVYLRSLQVDGDIDFANEYAEWGNPFGLGSTATGYHRNIFGVGPAILWAPFFLATHLLAVVGAKLGYPVSLDGMSRFHQIGTFYGTFIYGWLALLFSYLIARRVLGRQHALWAALGAALAGPLPFYSTTWASYSHAQAAMAASLLVLLWIRWRESWTTVRWVCFGATLGLLLLVRPACAGFALLPLFEVLRLMRAPLAARDLPAACRALLAPLVGAAAALVVFSPQLVVWKILHGRLLAVPQGEGFMRWSETAWHSTLFSPRDGLLLMAPLMAVALLGLLAFVRRQPALGAPLLAVFCAALIINGAAYDWWGWGFSSRRFTHALPIFALGLAAALKDGRELLARNPRRTIAWLTGGIVFLAIVFNIQWMSSFGQKGLSWYTVRSSQGLYMTVMHNLVDKMYSTIGNPLSLPASLAFSIRRGGSPKIYDRVDASFLLGEAHELANPAARQDIHATVDMGDLRFRHFLSESFGNPRRHSDGTRFVPLREPHSHVFLPINRPGPLRLVIGARAMYAGTRLSTVFNGRPLAVQGLPHDGWAELKVEVPGRLVERGINRLDLVHELPRGWSEPLSRAIGATDVEAPVDVAVVSGGLGSGSFSEIWVANRKVSENVRGVNVAVIDPVEGRVLGQRAFDVTSRPGNYRELGRYLRFFAKGSIVALAARDNAGRTFAAGNGREVLALFGAATDLAAVKRGGYVAIGVIGASAGSAAEALDAGNHARVRAGYPPPPWRELARYRAIRLE